MTSAERQSNHSREKTTYNRRSAAVSFGRFLAARCRTSIWCRSATISNSMAARGLNKDRRAVTNSQNKEHRIGIE
jgi:hypothetical protein